MRALRPTSIFALIAAAVALALTLPTAASGARGGYDGWTAESGADPVATISDLDVTHDAIAPGTRGGEDRVELSFTSTIAQRVRITVLDAAGREVRQILDAQLQPGPAAYAWNGTRGDGTRVVDGAYELVVEAETDGESMSISGIVRIDRRAPVVRSLARRVRLTSRTARSFRLPIFASERVLVQLRTSGASGRARATSARAAGRSSIVVPIASGAAVRRALARGRARVAVRLHATDDAGNTSARTIFVELLPPRPRFPSTSPGDDTPIVGSSRLSWPLSAPITSRFGPRWGRMHNGIDMGAPTGRAIRAAAPGRVTYAGWMSGYGTTVIVDHGRIETLYAHQSRIAVRSGQSVARGRVVGYVGSTGNSTGPHLHFEVRIGGVAKDPLRYLP